MTLLLQDSSNSTLAAEAATDAAQTNLEEAMNNDDLLSPNMPEVLKVTYLGDSYDEYMAGFVEGESGLAAGGFVTGTPGGIEGDGTGDGGSGLPFLAIILGGVFGALMVAMCALLFVKKRMREQSKFDDAQERARSSRGRYATDSQMVGGDFDWVTLRVGNLSPDTSVDDVREIFEQHGTVSECIVPNTSKEERFALVTMQANEAEKACNYVNGIEVDGHQLSVRKVQHQGGMANRNLIDDTSSEYDNSYQNNSVKNSCGRSGNNNGDEDEQAPGVLATLGVIGGFLAAPFLFKPCKKKSRQETSLAHLQSITGRSYAHSPDEQSLDDGLDNIINSIDGATDLNDRRNFVVDPPGAFHLGNHHYTGDGVRYFSPLCGQCIAAQRNADGVVPLVALHDNEEDPADVRGDEMDLNEMGGLSFDLEEARNFTDYNCNDLSRAHSSMHVRHCKSTTCNICAREKGVYFVKARKEPAPGEVL